eukprot:Protomagalhaensia_sp_Gyna_25__923@NODE_1445_length_1829_cov_24_788268_g1169_i0_p1_GENE_NODE_1445_length_1829_cov_24_788268_g1169_i0NODE_1445_length_1829_cov_24_788268_g1169_i0_p1_ORF_typecomplete_len376_score50_91Bax1I/PF01027_20/1_5e09TRI12/PF06609_13/1_5DUF2842/PF11003_8/4_4e03DUF2842/PF11003_8/0_38_NODE_1445_length_1829_cov_24_788268_g1169_i03201447
MTATIPDQAPPNQPRFQPIPYSPEPKQYQPDPYPFVEGHHQFGLPPTGAQDDVYRFHEYPLHPVYSDGSQGYPRARGYDSGDPLDYPNAPPRYHHELQGYSQEPHGYQYPPPNLEPHYAATTSPLGTVYGPPPVGTTGTPDSDRPPLPAEARRPLTLKFDEDARRRFVRVVYSLLALQLALMAGATVGVSALNMDILRGGLALFMVGMVLYVVLAVWFIYWTPRNAAVNGLILFLTAIAWAFQLGWIDGVIPSVAYWLAPTQSAVAAGAVAAFTYQSRIKFLRWHIYACVIAEILLVQVLLTAIPRLRNGAPVGTALASLSAIVVIASTIAIGQQLCRATHPYLSVEPSETFLAAASLFYYRKTYNACEPQRRAS